MKTITVPPNTKLGLTINCQPRRGGAIIKTILETCPFAEDVSVGDVITAVNGKKIRTSADLKGGEKDGGERILKVLNSRDAACGWRKRKIHEEKEAEAEADNRCKPGYSSRKIDCRTIWQGHCVGIGAVRGWRSVRGCCWRVLYRRWNDRCSGWMIAKKTFSVEHQVTVAIMKMDPHPKSCGILCCRCRVIYIWIKRAIRQKRKSSNHPLLLPMVLLPKMDKT
mmetsp:Transcript_1853/g.3815  ORF Transcript_1853/g.3815 Transcript_1853/m.3815 type:complete len:223 (+) Transcript_1853:82-750(+)